MTLEEYMKRLGKQPIVFKPGGRYNRGGDYLEVFWKDDPAYAEQINTGLAVYKSFTNGEVVGCAVYGIKAFTKEAGDGG